MSLYAATSGEVTYKNREEYNKVIEELISDGYVEKCNMVVDGETIEAKDWLDESGESLEHAEPNEFFDDENMVITIPTQTYRNLSRFHFFTPSASGKVCHSTDDGGHSAWYETENGETNCF